MKHRREDMLLLYTFIWKTVWWCQMQCIMWFTVFLFFCHAKKFMVTRLFACCMTHNPWIIIMIWHIIFINRVNRGTKINHFWILFYLFYLTFNLVINKMAFQGVIYLDWYFHSYFQAFFSFFFIFALRTSTLPLKLDVLGLFIFGLFKIWWVGRKMFSNFGMTHTVYIGSVLNPDNQTWKPCKPPASSVPDVGGSCRCLFEKR